MTTNNEKKRRRKSLEDKILAGTIIVMIVTALFIGAGTAIWNSIVSFAKTIAPNVGAVVIAICIAIICFLLGRRSVRSSKSE